MKSGFLARTIIAVLFSSLILHPSAFSQVPGIINYQGRVSIGGTNFTGTGQFKFALVDGGSTFSDRAQGFAFVSGPAIGYQITGVNVTVPGSGYTNSPAITFPNFVVHGTGAVLTANISGGHVTSVTVNNPGTNYDDNAGGNIDLIFAVPPPTTVFTSYWSNDGISSNGAQPTTVVSLPVTNGLYSVLLGDTSLSNMASITATVFSGADRRLRVWFNDGVHGFQQLSPDQRISSVGYALQAQNAATAVVANGLVGASDVTGQRLNVGVGNNAGGAYIAIAGGSNNTTSADFATIGGGNNNTASALNATVGGGANNNAAISYATVAGGQNNSASNAYATVAGGDLNTASGNEATVAGGTANIASGPDSAVGGGTNNVASGVSATIGGGAKNIASNTCATVAGGYFNSPSADYATVGGGVSNNAANAYTTISGGLQNAALGTNSTVSGGHFNDAWDDSDTISGGRNNEAHSDASTVAGGDGNIASGNGAAVGGGYANKATGGSANVGGGFQNLASGLQANVGGGNGNWASGTNTTVSGGLNNFAAGFESIVSGGFQNTASGVCSTVPGGSSNSAEGQNSFAAGSHANAFYDGAFVWADSTPGILTSGRPNEFLARASGGVYFITSTNGVGVGVDPGGNSWGILSDRNMKEHFQPVDTRAVLEKVAAMPVTEWNLISQDPSIRHIGPMAQDFKAAFGLGTDDRHITSSDADGIALAAIQGLYQELQDEKVQLQAEKKHNAAKDAEIRELIKRLDELEKRMQK